MIRNTVRKVGKQLEQLSERNVPLTRAFDVLTKKAKSIEEIVVIEVMREVYREVIEQEEQKTGYIESNTLSARMPSMALSR